ncbi:MAG: rhomboid family intramembrane serine protease [Candidatus Zixiibacteriota bacterium]
MFIPLKDENPTANKPIVTILLIAINSAVYLYSLTLGDRGSQIFLFKFGLIPYEIIHITELTPQIAVPVFLNPFTSMFLHGGFMHLAGNMLFLWIFGNNIEDYLGPIKFLFFYILAGLAAAFLFVVFSPNSEIPMVGASGAIAGVLGAYLVLFPHARVITLVWIFFLIRIIRLPAKFMLGFWFFYQLFMSLSDIGGMGGGVAWLAHVGGFAFGYFWFKRKRKIKVKREIEYL